MKYYLSIILFLTAVCHADAQISFYPEFIADQDTLSLNKDVLINEMPAIGTLFETGVFDDPDSVRHVTMPCGSIFDTAEESYYYTFNIYTKGVLIESNGNKYQFRSMNMADNTFTFHYEGQQHTFTENTLQSEFTDLFTKSTPYDSLPDSDGQVSYNVYLPLSTEDNWIFTFRDNKLIQIYLSQLLC